MKYFDDRISPYLPSLQPMWVETLGKRLDDYRANIPHGSFRSLDEFNWYDGANPRFSHPFGLYSPGHAELDLQKARVIDRLLFDRDRDNTFLLVDSGGYQVGSRSWPIATLDRQIPKVIAWQETIADLAVILEVPAWMKDDNGERIAFDYALSETNKNLEAYTRHASGDVKFIVPLHGRDFPEACEWFEGTKWFNEKGYGVGWCFSDAMSGDLSLALKVLLYMVSKGHYPEYLHFLGQGSPQAAIVCEIMRRVVPRSFRDLNGREHGLTVTMDASSEFRAWGQFGMIYERVAEQYTAKNRSAPYRIRQTSFFSSDRNAYPSEKHYPDVEGPILGREDGGVVFGDILAPAGNTSAYNVDAISSAVLIAHNLWVKLDAVKRLRKFESAMRRISYGRDDENTREMADMLSRLIHGASTKGQPTDVGIDLVASTRGLWKIFRPAAEHISADDAYVDAMAALSAFEAEAFELFPRDATAKKSVEEDTADRA